jgi:hypothetical protein
MSTQLCSDRRDLRGLHSNTIRYDWALSAICYNWNLVYVTIYYQRYTELSANRTETKGAVMNHVLIRSVFMLYKLRRCVSTKCYIWEAIANIVLVNSPSFHVVTTTSHPLYIIAPDASAKIIQPSR